MEKTKPLSKEERFVCEMIWGGVPVDIVWVRNGKMFQENLNGFLRWGDWKIFCELDLEFKKQYSL